MCPDINCSVYVESLDNLYSNCICDRLAVSVHTASTSPPVKSVKDNALGAVAVFAALKLLFGLGSVAISFDVFMFSLIYLFL